MGAGAWDTKAGDMQEANERPTRRGNWRRNGVKGVILLLLLTGTAFGITQAIILLALYSLIIIPM
jgi:hypothetical protein